MSLSRFVRMLVAVLLCSVASAQLVEENHPELGIKLSRPSAYQHLPLPPSEAHFRLAWLLPAEAGGLPAALFVGLLGEDGTPGDTAQFLSMRVRPKTSKSLRGGASRFGMQPVRFEFERVDDNGFAVRGLLLGWEGEGRTVFVMGESSPKRFEAESRRWRLMADTLRMTAPERNERDRGHWERHYAKGRYAGEARRIEERLRLPSNWEARDTQHYLVLTHGTPEALVLQLTRELEVLRARFVRDLPPAVAYDKDRASVVRVCVDRNEYLSYGGPPSTSGYFSVSDGELVLFMAEPLERTFGTLYHEAFHQYVNQSTGGVAPQSWFDEGTGDYYSGTHFERGVITGVRANAHRLRDLKAVLAAESWTPMKELLLMDQAAYYRHPAQHYAQGWGLVYFLRNSELARSRPLWGQLTARYYRALAKAWSVEVEQAGARLDRREAGPPRTRALKVAMDKALEGVDLGELEKALQSWVRAQKMPADPASSQKK
ncbi:MAG: hypothetical protein ACI8QC_000728 [Planctomycetota bacterium]|jgi:hypothetical protein